MKISIKIFIGIIVGGLIGFSYYYFIGCNSGTCPLTSRWYISTLIGSLFGLLFGVPSKKK